MSKRVKFGLYSIDSCLQSGHVLNVRIQLIQYVWPQIKSINGLLFEKLYVFKHSLQFIFIQEKLKLKCMRVYVKKKLFFLFK